MSASEDVLIILPVKNAVLLNSRPMQQPSAIADTARRLNPPVNQYRPRPHGCAKA